MARPPKGLWERGSVTADALTVPPRRAPAGAFTDKPVRRTIGYEDAMPAMPGEREVEVGIEPPVLPAGTLDDGRRALRRSGERVSASPAIDRRAKMESGAAPVVRTEIGHPDAGVAASVPAIEVDDLGPSPALTRAEAELLRASQAPAAAYVPSSHPTPSPAALAAVDLGYDAPAERFDEERFDETPADTETRRQVSIAPTMPATHSHLRELRPPGRVAVLDSAGGSAPRYDRREVLVEGPTGEVMLAHDRDIGRNVAVKRLPRALEREQVDGFVREVRTVGALEHPNIVPIHDVDRDADGRLYFVMKHVEGETLEHIIEKLQGGDPTYRRRWTIGARVDLFLGVLRALAYAHAQGVVHRDVKPANVMVGAYGEVVLMDWGIARHLDRPDPARGRVVGTPYYMSPEQARAEAVDERSDLYSAGVLLHELLTLEHYLSPLDEPRTVLRRVAKEGWRRPLASWHRPRKQPMPPMELGHYVRRAMAFQREERWRSAAEMIAELTRIREGRPRVQCHLTLTKRVARSFGHLVDRWPYPAFALLLGLAALAAYGVAVALLSAAG